MLGAIVAPTDPVAAIATFDRVGVTDGSRLLVEGESMVNDATALVAYRVALAAVVAGAFAVGEAAVELVVAVAGGIAIGLAVAWAAAAGAASGWTTRRWRSLLSVLIGLRRLRGLRRRSRPRACWPWSRAGLYLGWRSHEDVFDADDRA